jgi:hypothetical protein
MGLLRWLPLAMLQKIFCTAVSADVSMVWFSSAEP